MTITFPMAHHYCITDTAAHGQEIFKTMIQFPNHEQVDYLFSEINMIADARNCMVIDCLLTNDQTGRGWDEYDGRWQT
ncbi:hypothetical protein SY86_25995 [Erwinia tracheiphila]|uniref:Uncharacterized protein n=1 Tax=Erwinia tracheiphila TaxID=65700 RepID=A0A0M2KAP5_9GAMM|nr:hypothetical protein SY86_25995 [Erwinia tracheiphila]